MFRRVSGVPQQILQYAKNGSGIGSIFCRIRISITLSNKLLGKYNPKQLKLEMTL